MTGAGLSLIGSVEPAARPSVPSTPLADGQGGRFRLYSLADVLELPEPEWLIDGVIEVRGFAGVYGPPSSGKSFVALDWALCVARGDAWQGRAVKQGPVVYVVGEGGKGISKRVRAWLREHELETVEGAFFVLEPVPLRNQQEFGRLLERIKPLSASPRLILFDTLATCFGDGDENSAQDMGKFIDAVRKIQQETGATVLIVHHTGKSREGGAVTERGSSALRAAADTMVKVQKTKSGPTLTCDKQKDDEEFRPIHLQLKSVAVGRDADGRDVTSCVLVAATGKAGNPELNPNRQRAIEVLATSLEESLSTKDWRDEVSKVAGKKVSEKTFDNWRRALVEMKLVEPVDDGRRAKYRLTDRGAAIAKREPLERHGCEPAPPTPPPPPPL